MSAEAAFASRTWSVGRYECTLTVPRPKPGQVMQACMEWTPEQPRKLTNEEITQYRQGRNKALTEISQSLGIKTAVLEL